jgi:ferredoxin-NADP reductase
MCGEFFRDGQAVDVDWPSEEERIYRELSVVSEPY